MKVYQSLTICLVSWRMLFRHQCCGRFHGKIQRDQRKVLTRCTRWNRWKQRSGALMTETDNQRRTSSSVQVWTSRLLGWKLDHFIYNWKNQGLKVIIIFLSRIQISQNCYYQTLSFLRPHYEVWKLQAVHWCPPIMFVVFNNRLR